MHQNFSLIHNMQIPQENIYNVLPDRINLDEEIEMLSVDYEIINPGLIKCFLEKNVDLVQYIKSIIPLINMHFPDYKKCLTFCQDPEFEELDDITIYISSCDSQFDRDWKKLDQLEKDLFYLNGFSNELKGLVSVDLWLK